MNNLYPPPSDSSTTFPAWDIFGRMSLAVMPSKESNRKGEKRLGAGSMDLPWRDSQDAIRRFVWIIFV